MPADLAERVYELVWGKSAKPAKSKETTNTEKETEATIAELIARATANKATLLALAERVERNDKQLELLRLGRESAL